MSKSILLIDTPKYCIDCPCHFSYEEMIWCGKERKELLADDIETFKPDWCPLKDVPERKIINPDIYFARKSDTYSFGWNACLDEILKGCE